MLESDGFNSAEAGPSRPRYDETRPFMNGKTELGSPSSSPSYQEEEEEEENDPEESTREDEASLLEDILTSSQRPALPSKASSSLLSRPQLSSRQSSKVKSRHPLASLDFPPSIHTSSSEVFDLSSTPGLKGTTYSSLPPSPRGEVEFDYTVPPPLSSQKKGLGIKELDSVLGKLTVPSSSGYMEDEEEGEDEFWPARSRRPTITENNYTLNDPPEEGIRISSPEPEDENAHLHQNYDEFKGLNAEGKIEISGIWDLLKDEMGAEEWDGWVVDGKWERIANFLAVPLAVEKTTLFGALLCLDGFLYNFTVLPIRSAFALTRILTNVIKRKEWWPIPLAHQHSILRMLLLLIPTVILLGATDSSKMYHSVRGQDTIKLYVIFNALEIADRLCCAFGQDVLDTLFARETLSPSIRKRGKGRKRQQARPVFFFALSLGYVLAHTLIFFYMLVSLNVAINSYDYTLLSLLISNQFVEIKGSVFKKFEKENLFQIMCADIVERFQLSLMLFVIALRNMIEMAGSEIAFLPKSFIRGKNLVDSILSPVLFVIVSEMIVDWLKHAFITKFNHVRASVYERFTDVLAKDVLLAGSSGNGRGRMKGRNHQVLLDQSPLVARRLGFASIPLACLVLRVSAQAIGMLSTSSHHDESLNDLTAGDWVWTILKWTSWTGVGLCAWGCLVFLKVILGLALLSFSAIRQEGMEAREAEDAVNDFGRSAVGESKEETEYNKQTARYLSHPNDDLPAYPSPGSVHTPTTTFSMPKSVLVNNARRMNGGSGSMSDPEKVTSNSDSETKDKDKEKEKGGKKGKKWKLEEVERWTMVKRIW
ncbi:hypothetical protein I302_101676 [Kwoniella bestiolae CBS 10118]|uniref:DUF747-domain-containing protein n=1 Tax=Kwoniella bestiolae CBS 10118 TaxID=1296100 RepID=A0A1B9GCW3_9TREE|nr:hypothetical protein I302_00353 [Kwoniella bestiolae CBS 10118]OCF28863.1 hypothetical protein I302_00353 [Kwoniella bestiolae CBS 10118]